MPPLDRTLLPAKGDEPLELDELWSFVARRKEKKWVWSGWSTPLPLHWLALCRRTRQVVAYAIGDRGRRTCRVLWERIPQAYRTGQLFTDFWEAYRKVLPDDQHVVTDKGDGQTSHTERFNNVLRQRLARFVRRTLSFSKLDRMHDACLRIFLHEYNRQIANTS